MPHVQEEWFRVQVSRFSVSGFGFRVILSFPQALCARGVVLGSGSGHVCTIGQGRCRRDIRRKDVGPTGLQRRSVQDVATSIKRHPWRSLYRSLQLFCDAQECQINTQEYYAGDQHSTTSFGSSSRNTRIKASLYSCPALRQNVSCLYSIPVN